MSFRSSAMSRMPFCGRVWPSWICGIFVGTVSMAVCGVSASGATTGKQATAAMKEVSFLGYRALVPASWRVVNLRATPAKCVRFDQHAVYLGVPGPVEHCPAHLIAAKTESLLVEPLRAGYGASSAGADAVAHQYVVDDAPAGVQITAAYGSDEALIKKILSSAALIPERGNASVIPARAPVDPASIPSVHPPVRAPHESPSPARELLAALLPGRAPPAPAPAAALPAGVTNDAGLGFDACAAPGPATMRAWLKRSPYRAVGIYIGGSDRACAQPNLTAGWVSRQAAAGWRFIPLYVGPQAEWGQITAAAMQGVSAADDAVVQAQALGFGRGSPLYYDMEAYPRRQSRRALRFLSAWTDELHAVGYASGVYSSSGSAMADLADHSAGYPSYPAVGGYTMPDVIFDALWNGGADTIDPLIRPDEWAYHQRIHQFSGATNRTFGGHRLNIDRDYLDVQLPASLTLPTWTRYRATGQVRAGRCHGSGRTARGRCRCEPRRGAVRPRLRC